MIGLAAGGGHLVHHAAGGADDEVLDLLREERQGSAVEGEALERGDRFERGDLQRGRRAHPLAGRDVGANQEAHGRAGRTPCSRWRITSAPRT